MKLLLLLVAVGFCHALPNPKAKNAKEEYKWWQHGNVYQIYPRSFQDTDGDGVGDLKGIIQRLDSITDLEVNMVWISPIYRSPMKDFGYDISSFIDIDPIFGTMEDFDALMVAATSKGIKIIMDMVPNHSSDEHEWFIKSVAREDPYTDYYIWSDGKLLPNGTRAPPNNWHSVFGGSAWEWNEERGQYYLHQFVAGQPDLNYRNPLVVEELKNILRFWLRKGVAGFRCDAVAHMFESPGLEDEPLSGRQDLTPFDYDYYLHIHTRQLPEVFDVIGAIRDTLQEFEDQDGVHRIMFTEAYENITEIVKYFGTEERPLADFPFNFALITEIQMGFTGTKLYEAVKNWYDNMPSWAWANWVVGNHDNHRVASRVGPELVDAINMLSMLLPGTPVSYNGEEIGMEDTFVSYEDSVDPNGCNYGPDKYIYYTRDFQRTPYQWDNTQNAGFSTANKTWLPVNSNYVTLNRKAQADAKVSHLDVYKNLVTLRKLPAIQAGYLYFPIISDTVFSFTRIIPGTSGYIIAINLGDEETVLDFSTAPYVPSEAMVEIRSVQATNPNTVPGYFFKSHFFYTNNDIFILRTWVPTSAIVLGPKEGMVLLILPLNEPNN